MLCATCGSYYRLTKFHNDITDCEDCAGVISVDEDISLEIANILRPSGKVQAHIEDREDE